MSWYDWSLSTDHPGGVDSDTAAVAENAAKLLLVDDGDDDDAVLARKWDRSISPRPFHPFSNGAIIGERIALGDARGTLTGTTGNELFAAANSKHKATWSREQEDREIEQLTETMKSVLGIRSVEQLWSTVPTAITSEFGKTYDKALGKELLELPSETRNKINEEVHGIYNSSEELKESPELLVRALHEMDGAINSNTDSIPVEETRAHAQIGRAHV
mgnify:CR=1 FL=1